MNQRIIMTVFLVAIASLTILPLLRQCRPPEPEPPPPTSTYTPLPPTVTAKPPKITETSQPDYTDTPEPTETSQPPTATLMPTSQPTDTATATKPPRVTAIVLPTDTPEGPGSLPVTGGEPVPWVLSVAIGAFLLLGAVALGAFND